MYSVLQCLWQLVASGQLDCNYVSNNVYRLGGVGLISFVRQHCTSNLEPQT